MSSESEYAFIELAAKLPGGGMVRNRFVRRDDREALRSWRCLYGNTDIYGSVCCFGEADRNGAYVCDFFLDVDAPDLEQARSATLMASDLLAEQLAIDPDGLDISFSGAKGFHLIVARKVFGDPEGPLVMTVWRCLAGRLAKAGVPCIDLCVYQPARVLRLPNSIHSKTGLHKVCLEYRELADLDMAYVLDLARQPREHEGMALPAESDRAVAWMRDAMEGAAKHEVGVARRAGLEDRSGWRLPPCIRTIEWTTLPDGVRHEAYFQYARYMATIGAAPDEILHRLRCIDARHSIRDDRYLESVARRATKYSGFKTCPLPQLEGFCDRARCPLVAAGRPCDRRTEDGLAGVESGAG